MHKVKLIFHAVIFAALITSQSAIASPVSDALGNCMADNTTGKDRKDMARWMFVAISVHPEMRNLSQISKNDQDNVDMLMGNLVTKLLTESCSEQAKNAMNEGGEAFKTAFSVLGQLAMQELMTNPDVKSSISGFGKYIDKDKMNAVFTKK